MMIRFFVNLIVTIIANGTILYAIATFLPELGLIIDPIDVANIPGFLILGFVFRLTYGVLRKILSFVTLPLRFLTLGFSSVVLNVFIFYLFKYLINNYAQTGITVSFTSIGHVIVLSVVMWFIMKIVSLVIKRVI